MLSQGKKTGKKTKKNIKEKLSVIEDYESNFIQK